MPYNNCSYLLFRFYGTIRDHGMMEVGDLDLMVDNLTCAPLLITDLKCQCLHAQKIDHFSFARSITSHYIISKFYGGPSWSVFHKL